jgi:Zn-dependent metalloprotease
VRLSHCHILPPHVLEQIARNGTHDQRSGALDTLSIDQTVRAFRLQAAGIPRASTPASLGAVHGADDITIRNANNQATTQGQTVRKTGQPATGDKAADEAYAGLHATHDFFWNLFARDSIDDQGLPLVGVVHYGQKYQNAFWDGQEMVFGDGDGQLFNRFTIAIDVIGHELTHGVTEDEAHLEYIGQPGALNESISDVFGSLVKQRALNQTAAQADWLIGQGLLGPAVKGTALRSMKAPGTAYDDPVLGKDPQPDHMTHYVNTSADNRGVHINSGIPNRAFYLAAAAMGGYAWEKAGRIWYNTLRSPRVKPRTGFRSFARTSLRTAEQLYGVGSTEAAKVEDAWKHVGVL